MPERMKKQKNKINILFNFINYWPERMKKIKTRFYFINSILFIIPAPRSEVELINKIENILFY